MEAEKQRARAGQIMNEVCGKIKELGIEREVEERLVDKLKELNY